MLLSDDQVTTDLLNSMLAIFNDSELRLSFIWWRDVGKRFRVVAGTQSRSNRLSAITNLAGQQSSADEIP
ncbi:hypothetical protein J6590_091379 [Homalodisca vitripennis]|nr:hypothetical protein J6590_091379 [Homalodisca vitripennis]